MYEETDERGRNRNTLAARIATEFGITRPATRHHLGALTTPTPGLI